MHGRSLARGRRFTSRMNIEGRAALFAAPDLVPMNDLPVEGPQSCEHAGERPHQQDAIHFGVGEPIRRQFSALTGL